MAAPSHDMAEGIAAAQVAPLLEKKASFQKGLSDITCSLKSCSSPEQLQALLPLLARTSVLLKTRYTNPSHYLTALGAYRACLESSCLSAQSRPKIEAYVKDAEAFLAANDVEVPGGHGDAGATLGDLMLGIGGSTRPSVSMETAPVAADGTAGMLHSWRGVHVRGRGRAPLPV